MIFTDLYVDELFANLHPVDISAHFDSGCVDFPNIAYKRKAKDYVTVKLQMANKLDMIPL